MWSSPGNFMKAMMSVLWAWVLAQICEVNQVGNYLSTVKFARTWMTSLVAFVLGGFVTLNVARWSRTRSTYSYLCGKTREHLMVASALVRTNRGDSEMEDGVDKAHAYRDKIGRYTVLALELTIRRAQGKMDSVQTKTWLQKLGLLSEDEWERMVVCDRHTTVYTWLLAVGHQAAAEGMFGQYEASDMSTSIKAALGAANELIDTHRNPMPLPYVQMVTVLVKSYMLICSTEFGMDMASATNLQTFQDGPPTSYIILSLMAVFLLSSCMQGLLDLHAHLHSPFMDMGSSPQEVTVNQSLNQLRLELLGRSPGSDFFYEADWEVVESPTGHSPRDEEEGFGSALHIKTKL
jgi:hypothetical protein